MSVIGTALLLGLLLEQTRIYAIFGLLIMGAFLVYPVQSTITAVIIGGIYLFTRH